uniref:Uncharacterized protein n=1 Tax=Brassica campestris TaxID=3711 RepID=A0A3P5ZTG7_BRACM|nr:unnamed protein product [Brassica rapa]
MERRAEDNEETGEPSGEAIRSRLSNRADPFLVVLEYWAGRGMLQIFVAVMTRAFPDYMTQRKDLLLLQNIASYMLLACVEILCIGFF